MQTRPATRTGRTGSTKTSRTVFSKFSKEFKSLIIAVAITAVIFAYDRVNPAATVTALPLALIVVTVSFALHELAHRFVAKKFGCAAIYELWMPGVLFSFLLMFVGIRLAIIGASAISAYKFSRWGLKSRPPTITETGLIAISGPVVNLALAVIFKILAFYSSADINYFFAYASYINSWLLLFNLVPLKQLDGGKILFWTPIYWFVLLFSFILLITPFGIFSSLLLLH